MIIFGIAMFLVGVLFTLLGVAKLHAGTLKVYISDDPNEESCVGLKLEKHVGAICRRKYVLLDVNIHNLNTHE